ncbi:N-formylglutamate amidohydrolase [Novosphingobium bradum]|uniref:N-formylglutamate amidohydrolase n=1 Tax=Novosphingobium bradum TaxID=1737444 RepID=A0ABV7ILA6_9SPHN
MPLEPPDRDSLFLPDLGGATASGGAIPGLANEPAWVLAAREPSAIPVLIAVPHAGRVYPPGVEEHLRSPAQAAQRLEDRLVDRLGEAVAAATGAALLVARAPRAMIDLNRAPDDVDWSMFTREPDEAERLPGGPGGRAGGGLGLVPRRLPGIGELWKRPQRRAELEARLAQIHRPYHAELASQLARLRERWGTALLLDLHSMPPMAARGGMPAPEFVVGDRFGASCAGTLTALAFAWFARGGRLAAHNRPYAGGYSLDCHADPRGGVHAFQIEIARSSYLDSHLMEPGAGFAAVADHLAGLVRALAAELAAMGQMTRSRGRAADGWAQAAE